MEAEYAAVFAYGVVGSQVPDPQRSYALAALAEHRAARDWLRDQLGAAGATAPGAAAAYDTGDPHTPDAAAQLAAQVELATVPRWAAVAGVVPPAQRVYAATRAQAGGVRALTWGAPSQAFPGTVDAGASPSSSPTLSGSASDSGSPSDLNSTPGSAAASSAASDATPGGALASDSPVPEPTPTE